MGNKNIVVDQELAPDWQKEFAEFFKKFSKQKSDLDRQVLLGWEHPGKGITLEQFQLFLEHREAFGVSNWLLPFLLQELKCHLLFFGREFDLVPFTETLKHYGLKHIQAWQKLGLEPHFLPDALMIPELEFPGWKIQPEEWLYTQTNKGKIFRLQNGGLVVDTSTFRLEGVAVLIDTRPKPAYTGGDQMYENDNFLGPIIERLRASGSIQDYTPRSSRFNVSSEEWEKVKPEVARLLGLELTQVRLERTIEGNVIPQLYPQMPRKDDGTTNTWEWREEFFASRSSRLFGGYSGYGGLAGVGYRVVGYRWRNQAVRSLAVL